MKKLLKILTTIAAVLAAALFFAGCKQFLENPEEFLGPRTTRGQPRRRC